MRKENMTVDVPIVLPDPLTTIVEGARRIEKMRDDIDVFVAVMEECARKACPEPHDEERRAASFFSGQRLPQEGDARFMVTFNSDNLLLMRKVAGDHLVARPFGANLDAEDVAIVHGHLSDTMKRVLENLKLESAFAPFLQPYIDAAR